MIGYFIFDDIDTRNYEGIAVTEVDVDSAPERVYEEVIVAGRSGTILMDMKRYDNVVHSYDVVVYDDYVDNLVALRNDLLSKVGYHTLTDSFNTDEKYLATVYASISPNQKTQRNGGYLHVEFSRKPQRYLISGETAVTPSDYGNPQTETGELVTIDSDGSLGVKSLEVSLSPIQDLNGYGYPWVGGAGKNKLPTLASATTVNGITATPQTDGTVKVTGTATANVEITIGDVARDTAKTYMVSGCPSGGGSSTYRQLVRLRLNGSALQTLSETGNGYAVAPTLQPTATEIRVAIWVANGQTVNLTYKPMVEIGSSVTTYEPYSNICPISGRTSVETTRTGKNLLTYTETHRTISGVSIDISADGVLHAYGTAREGLWVAVGEFEAKGGKTYFYGNLPRGMSTTTYFVTRYGSTGNTYEDSEYTFANDTNAVSRFYVRQGVTLDVTFKLVVAEAENSTTYTTSLGRTVYGGTLDVVSGVLAVDKVMLEWLSSSNFGKGGATTVDEFFLRPSVAGVSGAWRDAEHIICSHAKNVESTSGITAPYPQMGNGQPRIVFPLSMGMSLANFTTWLDEQQTNGTPLQVCYMLATPQTYQLTPQQIDLLLGTNHLWSDGEITVEYGVHPYYNPTQFESKPLLVVTGKGVLQIGDYVLNIGGTEIQTLYIDCDSQEAWEVVGAGKISRNDYIRNAGEEFPVLMPGINNISVGSGISNVTITPRWWRL